ncbi:S1C family serine protease [Catenisphaera adipataccumulans]|uniref:Serine protease Do n=1 Tax=Catenisphaera adipataccumulans TaxID=700500 RepID=A0A7W8FWS7_9FIRM|nr:trypsin-like peptidase domain-containing protein [Catenisphaera adipataccumulans]MBB5182920.1 serine protease Do [Catenisphaera adipataccumulans]
MEQDMDKKKRIKRIIAVIALVAACGISGFAGAKLGGGNSVTINQVTGKASNSIKSSSDYSDVASKCGPSVVEISTEGVSYGSNLQQYVEEGAGSGVIISSDGYIVTNYHVIENASNITVKTTDGNSYDATIVGTDSDTDLAVLKIDADNLTAATLGDSDSLEVGDDAIAIGNPLGMLGGTVTTGIISALNREITIDDTTMTLLQTDAAINPGNSGGGLFDADGNLIGIVNAKASSSGIEGLGFAIPINDAIAVVNELIANGKVTSRPSLGATLYDYSQDSNYYYSDSTESGVYIVQLTKGGAAAEAGLQENDRIVSVDGEKVSSASEVKSIIQKHEIGDKVKIVVERDGEKITKTVTLQQSTE